MHTCVSGNVLSRLCLSIGRHFKHSVDTLTTLLCFRSGRRMPSLSSSLCVTTCLSWPTGWLASTRRTTAPSPSPSTPTSSPYLSRKWTEIWPSATLYKRRWKEMWHSATLYNRRWTEIWPSATLYKRRWKEMWRSATPYKCCVHFPHRTGSQGLLTIQKWHITQMSTLKVTYSRCIVQFNTKVFTRNNLYVSEVND